VLAALFPPPVLGGTRGGGLGRGCSDLASLASLHPGLSWQKEGGRKKLKSKGIQGCRR
jgi:hypothetical protein